MDLSRLKPGDWLIGGGTLVFLVAMFLPWYGIDVAIFTYDNSGWDYFLGGIVPLLLLLAAFVVAVLPKLVESVKIPERIGPWTRARAALVAAGAALAIVLLRLIIPSDDVGRFDIDTNLDRRYGLFLALLAALAATAGAAIKATGREADTPGTTGQL